MSKNFIKEFKIEKALGDLRPVIEKGDKLSMFGCSYSVLEANNSHVMLEDESGTKLALPSNKMQLLLKSGHITKTGSLIRKALPQGGNSGSIGGMPVGTTRPDPKGGFRKKISMNPSVWVHLTNGTVHPDHQSDTKHEHLIHPEEVTQYNRVMDKVKQAKPEDQEKLKKIFHDYIKDVRAFKSLQHANSIPETDEKGNKMQLKNFELNHVLSFNDKARETLHKFTTVLKKSIKENKGK